ncbi:MAG: hypothetical protein JW822_03280 [Spirochaetales bacterium]|nr:hypothetical protein [Spirochaetales bacterium]
MKTIYAVVFIGTGLFFGITHATAEQPEVLLGLSMDFEKEEITIEVVSTGCTTKADFRFEYKDNVLTIIRKQPDTCKAMPDKITLTFKLKDLGIDPRTPFRISNTFLANENAANFLMHNTQ